MMAELNDCPVIETKAITETSGNGTSMKMRTAKSVMTSVITKTLHSIPGYDILESYRDHICTSLPDDYNNTAMRLQPLIGASDHMIQWILTGDMSKVNHRIYQVVLVFVCFEPHFIKFCDIMEVLVAESKHILDLRKILIKQLYKDKRITAEEASQLTSTKLFTVPPPTNATTILTIDGTDSSTTSCNVRSSYVCNTSIVDTNNTSSVATNQHVNALTSELAVETSDALAHATRTTNTHINNTSSIANSVFTSAVLDQHGQLECMSIGASVQPAIVEAHDLSNMTAVQSTDTNNVHHTVQSLQSISATEMTENLVNNIATDETVEDTSQIVYAVSDNEHGSMPETPLLAHSQQGNTRKDHFPDAGCTGTVASDDTVTLYTSLSEEEHKEQSLELLHVTENDVNADILSAANEDILSKPNTSAADSETAISCTVVNDDLTTKPDEVIQPMPLLSDQDKHTLTESAGNTVSEDSTATSEQAIVTATAKPANSCDTSSEQSSTSAPKLSSDEAKSITVVLTQGGPGTSDQLEINQMIDALIDNGWLSYTNIAALCLSSLQEKNEMLRPLLDGVKNLQDAMEHSEVHSKPPVKEAVSDKEKFNTDISEIGSKEVQEILENNDFAIVKAKYNEILACLPENHEAMIASLLNHLSDSQICDILSLSTGHAQNILNCLILKLKTKEDILDFCDYLEKLQEAPSSLKVVVEQLKKETIEMIQGDADRKHAPPTAEKPQTAAPPVRPPHKYLPFHPALLVLPKITDPFHLCPLASDSQGLAAMRKCYPLLIANLPSNHLISLVRLQDVAILPEEIVDSIVPSPSAEIGNKLIINYLIGLIHTEEHIITFCYFAERMLGEFDKCICVLNLKNTVVMDIPQVSTSIASNNMCNDSIMTVCESNSTAKLNVMSSAVMHEEDNSASSSNEPEVKFAGGWEITSIVREVKKQVSNKPRLDEIGVMRGFLQCMIIDTHGGTYNNTLKAIPLEEPPQDSSKEAAPVALYEREDIRDIKSFLKKDINKELAFSLCDAQRSKQYYLECIEVLFKECTKSGVWIYYSGYGEEGTGNWCFMDGNISFQDIFTLYKKYLKERLLYIFSDCSYSGQWVVDCAKCLDEMGIGACGHEAIKHGILIKVFSTCQPSQKATLGSYVGQKGIYFNETDCSIWIHYGKNLSDSQTTYGLDFTRIKCLQLDGPTAPCRLPDIPAKCSWKWKDTIALKYDNRPSSLIYTVRGTDRGRKAWHVVLVERELIDDFREKVSTGTIDVAKYGYVIKSGWGKDPPDDVLNNIKKYSPSW